MKYIESHVTDPYWNLALEEYVFFHMDPTQDYFMLWQNDNTIVIGKNQNTIAEINAEFVKSHGINIVRRLSGGGAVYHDLGNLNFTFITDADKINEIDFSRFCMPVVQTLQSLGIQAEVNGRNDMTIQGRKFSGNAQYVKNGRVLHHGTLLFSSDLSVVSQALHANKEKLQAKGIASVSSRVCNIAEFLPKTVSLADLKNKLLCNILQKENPEQYVFSNEDMKAIDRIKTSRYDLWSWNYGYSPNYQILKSRRIEGCGTVEIAMDVDKGTIRKIEFFGDFFDIGDLEELCQLLTGCNTQREALNKRLVNNLASDYIKGLSSDQLVDMLAEG